MRKGRQLGKVDRLKRGMASAVLVASLATQIAPLATVSAESLDYDHAGVETYKTLDTGQYRVAINPMIGAGNVGSGEATPQGGSYLVQQIAQYTSSGERIETPGATAQTVQLSPTEVNEILLDSDGEYRITPVDRVPGYLKDLGATHKVESDGVTNTELEQPAGHYIYAFPLIEGGTPAEGQTVDFQPKLREARTDLEIEKIGDDTTTPLANVDFTVYKTFDAQTGVNSEADPVRVATGTTGVDGKVEFPDLIEGEYFFVEEKASVPARYLPDARRVEFAVQVDPDEEGVFIVPLDDDDVTTVGNNHRGRINEGKTITRYNYVDPVQNKEETYQSVKSNYVGKGHDENRINTTQGKATGQGEGIVYVNTDGVVEFANSVDIPRNFNDYSEFTVVDTVDSKLTIDPSTVEMRLIGRDEGIKGTYTLDNGALTHDGQTITLNAKHDAIRGDLENSTKQADMLVITYKASVDTNEIAEGVSYDELTNTQTISADSELNDVEAVVNETVHTTNVRVREGRIVVDKDASDGQDTALAGAEFQLYRPAEEGEEVEIESHGRGWVKAENPRSGENYFGITDAEGHLAFENLQYGDYLLVETKAPEGYRLNNNHQLIEINDENSDIDVEDANTLTQQITNMRRNQIFPGTGTTGNIMTLVALAVAGGSLVTVTIKKRKENEGAVDEA